MSVDETSMYICQGYVHTLTCLNVNLCQIRFEVTYHTAIVVAVRVTGTSHETPDLNHGRQEEENDQTPWNVEVNSERPSTGRSSLRRLHPPAMTLCFQ